MELKLHCAVISRSDRPREINLFGISTRIRTWKPSCSELYQRVWDLNPDLPVRTGHFTIITSGSLIKSILRLALPFCIWKWIIETRIPEAPSNPGLCDLLFIWSGSFFPRNNFSTRSSGIKHRRCEDSWISSEVRNSDFVWIIVRLARLSVSRFDVTFRSTLVRNKIYVEIILGRNRGQRSSRDVLKVFQPLSILLLIGRSSWIRYQQLLWYSKRINVHVEKVCAHVFTTYISFLFLGSRCTLDASAFRHTPMITFKHYENNVRYLHKVQLKVIGSLIPCFGFFNGSPSGIEIEISICP